jgi:hypothetical protein
MEKYSQCNMLILYVNFNFLQHTLADKNIISITLMVTLVSAYFTYSNTIMTLFYSIVYI